MTIEQITDALYDIKYDVDNNSIEDLTLKEATCEDIVLLIGEVLDLLEGN